MAITSLVRFGLLPTLAAALVACSNSVEDDDAAASGAGGSTSGSGASSTSASSSAGGAGEGGASASSTTSSGGAAGGAGASGGAGAAGGAGPCDLDAQDCADADQSCYPTADGTICQATGDGEAWTQCESNLDCGEGLFCNPENFMHCVPWCKVAASNCEMNTVCYETDNIELPDGYGYCLPN